MEESFIDIIYLSDSGFLNDTLYELIKINDSLKLIKARPVMNESFIENIEYGIQFCYIANDEIKEKYKGKVKRILLNNVKV